MKVGKKTMLIAEDIDKRFAIVDALVDKDRFSVTRTKGGKLTLKRLQEEEVDIALLDLHLNDEVSGQSVIKTIRKFKPSLPIIAMTNEYGDPAVAECLALGADDVLVAPFSVSTFKARIDCAIRHCDPLKSNAPLEIGELKLDLKRQVAAYRGREVKLRSKEATVLKLLIQERGLAVESAALEKACWGEASRESLRLQHLISTTRRDLSSIGAPIGTIMSCRGVGYRIQPLN